MKRLITFGVGTWFALVLLATIMASTPAIADARVPDEATTSGGFDCADVTQIPLVECEALVTFFYATGGGSGGGWLVTNTPCEWDGITCDAGHVTGLERGGLVGSIPPELVDLTYLTLLDLYGEGLSGIIPSELGSLVQLETFFLTYDANQQVSLPPELGNLSSLETFMIAVTPVPATQDELSHLLEHRGCTTIPPEFGDLSDLQALGISYSLCGPIPPELASLSNLQYLWLTDNGLSGSIPPELGSLSNLLQLNLSNNSLSGSVPPELGNLSNLTHLDLGEGEFNCNFIPGLPYLSGPLPPELGNLSNLQYLRLACQDFSGPIPMTFINLLELQTFLFYATHLCEPPDPAFQAWIASVPNVEPTPGIFLCEPTSLPLYLPLVVR